MGTQLPSPKKGAEPPPQFFLLWPNGWMHQGATLYGGRPQTRGLWVKWGLSPPPKREAEAGGRVPQFLAHGYCGRTAGWIKMARGMEVGLGPVHIVPDGDTAPLPKTGGRTPQIFGPSLLWPNGFTDENAAWYGSRPRHRPHCTRRGPSSRYRGSAAPCFRPMSIVATVAHLSYC